MENKHLDHIDPIYNNVNKHMNVKDRIAYCERLILETRKFLDNKTTGIDQKMQSRYEAIIRAAEAELNSIKSN